MRVIAGTARGLTLQPPGKGTRPTMDRVRGAIFSSLGERVPNARVLDLFAGSGALGIEALSRGAASVIFVEQHIPTAGIIGKNLQRTRLHGSIQRMDAFLFLNLYASPGSFDLVLADPPYLKDEKGGQVNHADLLLQHPVLPAALGLEGLLVLECDKRQPLPSLVLWEVLSDRNYGESRVMILRFAT